MDDYGAFRVISGIDADLYILRGISQLVSAMYTHRDRHTSTRRKRGALLEQYDPLPEHGHRKTGR